MTDARRPRRCQIILLDERRLDLLVQPRLMSCDLLDMVASHVSLREKEYFGLSYTDEGSHQNWIRLDKRVLDHDFPRYHDPVTLVFCVRFFVPNILILKESSTVELFFLQAKILIFKGAIQSDSETVFELAALALHASCGDFTSEEAARSELRKLPVLPTRTLKERPSISYCEDKVLSYYKRSSGQTRGEAVVRYLCIFQSLPTYGVHYYEVKDKNSIPWWLGLSPKGIGLYDHGDKIKPRKIFMWSHIENIYFRDRKFSIEIRDSYRYEFKDSKTRINTLSRKSGAGNMLVHAWFSSTATLAKMMWSMAISQHQFYLDKKQVEAKMTLRRTLRDMARELSQSTGSLPSSATSDSVSTRSDQSYNVSGVSVDGGENVSSLSKAAEQEMLTALAARKEALLDKLKDRMEELKQLCLQEAELTGEYPPETPYTPGSRLPPIRRRVGTAFEFSESIISGEKNEDEEIGTMTRDVEIQSQITTAAQKLAEDRNVKKAVRKTRKLTYQKSLRRLRDMQENLQRVKDARCPVAHHDQQDASEADKGFYSSPSSSTAGRYMHASEKIGSHRYRTSVNLSLGTRRGSVISTNSFQDDEFPERGFHNGLPSPVISPYSKHPHSPNARSYHGHAENRRQHSPLANGPKAGKLSPRGDSTRTGPAFQYSDSDTRSDSSTKPSSVSSYANSEDLGENLEPYWHQRIGNSWESLNDNHLRGSSPRLIVSRSAGQSSESLCSDQDGSTSPYSPLRSQRSFSFDIQPQSSKISTKYLNTSDLAIVSTSGKAGSYAVNHNSKPGLRLAGKGFISTSLSTIDKSMPPANLHLRTAKSHTNMPFLTNPGFYRTNNSSESSIFEEDLLEWKAEEGSEAMLV